VAVGRRPLTSFTGIISSRSAPARRTGRWTFLTHARSGGNWLINGQATGLGLADFLVGRVASLEHGGPGVLPMNMWYVGLYAQDAWRMTSRMTINAGIRWEPYFGQNVTNSAIYNFDIDNFRNNVKSTVFVNAPAGLLYPGDKGFPPARPVSTSSG
jgi:hypothetical protein